MRQFFLVFLMLVMLGGAFSTQAAGVVGTGTPASCTEAALDAALAGGGTINFNCGAAAHTIFLSGPKTIRANTNIEADGLITFDGGGFTNLFYVMSGVELVIRDATLQNGRSINGGAIMNDQGRLSLLNVKFRRNEAVRADPTSITGLGGAIYNARGEVNISGGDFRGNRADRWGGAIFNEDGTVTIDGTFFFGNAVNASGDDGGAISNGAAGLSGGDLTIMNARFGLNTAPLSGGAIYGANSGTTRVTGTNFVWNLANVGGAISVIRPSADVAAGLEITQARFLTNVARYYGGAINTNVPTIITQGDFETNSARGGGAIQFYGTAEMYVTGTSFERNRATLDQGGAILNLASDLRILNSLFVRNLARQHGGGIFNNQVTTSGFNLRVVNTTFSYNRAFGQGGGIFNTNESSPSVWLRFVTLAYNQAPTGANLRSPGMRVQSSIIAHPVGGANCSTVIADISWVVQFGDTSCSTSALTSDPLLAPLADNGGFTWTHAIPAESPAVDGSLCPTFAEGIETDQRDFPRPGSGTSGAYACDIGAYEYQDLESASFPLTAQTATPAPTLPPVPTFAPTQVSVNCQPFRLTSPRDGLPNGGITVYWDAATGAAGYRVIVYNENNAAVASADAPANTTSLNLDVSEGAVGGGFTFTLEVQALLNNQAVCRDAASMLRSAPPAQQQCGNGIQEPGENPNNCPNGY